jgi:oxygen-dependent protoporphyrinogen oxidase
MKAAFYKIFRLENELGSTPSILEGGLLRQVELAQEKKKYFDPELPTYKGGALGSFKEGLLALPRAVQGTLGDKVKLGWKVESVTKEGEMYVTVFSTPEGTKKVRSKTVAVTAPAHATSKLLGDMMPEAAALDDISYPTVASVTLAYPKDALKDDVRRERPGLGMRLFGFGNLIPRSMKVRTLGTIWSSSLFPYRVPEGYEMMLSYIGGAQDPKNYSPAIAELSEAQIADIVHGDISTILLKDNAPQPKILGVRKVPPSSPLLLSSPPLLSFPPPLLPSSSPSLLISFPPLLLSSTPLLLSSSPLLLSCSPLLLSCSPPPLTSCSRQP